MSGGRPQNSMAVPPHDLPAEKSLLGSVLLDAHKLDDLLLVVRPEDFYLEDHRRVFEAMVRLQNAGQPVDAVSVLGAVPVQQMAADDVERLLTECLDLTPHPGHAVHYAERVVDRAERRRLLLAAGETLRDARDDSQDVPNLVAAAESRLHAIIERQTGTSGRGLGQVLLEALDDVEHRRAATPGVQAGFCDLDWLTNGLRPGALIILAARPSCGKTALAGNIAVNAARAGTAVLFLSLEQSDTELAERLVCSESGVSSQVLRGQSLRDQDREQVLQAAQRLADLPITVDDTTPRNVTQLAGVVRLFLRRNAARPQRLIVLDYLQLIQPEDKRQQREQQVADITRNLKCLAKSLKVPVIVLAQLNRQIEIRENKRPKLSDLRESGQIEADADLIWFIDRPATYDPSEDETKATLIVAKHRNGKTGDVALHWDKETMTFRNAARDLGGWQTAGSFVPAARDF